MSKKYEWLEKKTPRSVDQLRLWSLNPRLNLEEDHVKNSDFVEDFIREEGDKKNFFALIDSMANDGFVPADPIVVWQDEKNQKYYIAEGNRRVLALKLLRNPNTAPRSIRPYIRKASNKINLAEIEKIPVNVAPTFEDAEWYINQRNSSSSLQKPWTRVQQQRWILELYNKYNGDFKILMSKTKLSKSELESFFRILEIRDFIKKPAVRELLTDDEYNKARSDRFPITILERFFNFVEVKEKWGVEYDGIEVKIISNIKSFYKAFAELIKRIVNEHTPDDSDAKIDTRMKKENLERILSSLPQVNFDSIKEEVRDSNQVEIDDLLPEKPVSPEKPNTPTLPAPIIKNDPNRNRLILDIYTLNSSSYRLNGLFNELKSIPLKYNNSIAASIRIFLDLAILNYLHSENLIGDLCTQYSDSKGLKNINLSKRIEFLKPKVNSKAQDTIKKILNPSNELSLDVLNGYVHNDNTHYLNNRFLNNFWDLLFPLLEELIDIREI